MESDKLHLFASCETKRLDFDGGSSNGVGRRGRGEETGLWPASNEKKNGRMILRPRPMSMKRVVEIL